MSYDSVHNVGNNLLCMCKIAVFYSLCSGVVSLLNHKGSFKYYVITEGGGGGGFQMITLVLDYVIFE